MTYVNKMEALAAELPAEDKAGKISPLGILQKLIGFQDDVPLRLHVDIENLIMEVFETYNDMIEPEEAEKLGLPRPYPYPCVAAVRPRKRK